MGFSDDNLESNNTDNGPLFISDLVKELQQLQKQQKQIESQIVQLSEEHRDFQSRIDDIETAIKTSEVRETGLVVDAAKNEALRIGQRNTATAFLAVIGPIVVVFLAWFIPAAMMAIKHAQVEEERMNNLPPQQYGPPAPTKQLQTPSFQP